MRLETQEAERPLAATPTGDLLGQVFHQTSELLKREMELAKAEIGSEIKAARTMAMDLVVASVCGLLALGLLSAAVVLALADFMAAWAAALIVGGILLATAVVSISLAREKVPGMPLRKTQRTLKEDMRWAKERLA